MDEPEHTRPTGEVDDDLDLNFDDLEELDLENVVVDEDSEDELAADIRERSAEDPAFARSMADAELRSDLFLRLLARRQEKGLTQKDVAEAMGTTQSAVSDFESGDVDPRLSTIQRYADAVGLVATMRLVPREGDHVVLSRLEIDAGTPANLAPTPGRDRGLIEIVNWKFHGLQLIRFEEWTGNTATRRPAGR